MRKYDKGFTLIELVMVILLLAVLGAVAIPNFMDFRVDARNSATQGNLGSLRAAVAIATAAIALREDTGVPKYPTLAEMQANAFAATHPVLNGTAIMDGASGIPDNPWTVSTAPAASFNSVLDCSAKNITELLASPDDDRGWCYKAATGQIWANSDRNGGGANTENTY